MRNLLTRQPLPEFLGLASMLVASLLPSPALAQNTPSRPNFVLCMTDDQGWGDVGYNGNAVLQTPNLDAMAASGVRLDRFYAAQHNCSPTRASVLTGRHPDRSRTYAWGHDLPLRERTIATVARAQGYATGHFGKWHLGGIPNCHGGDGRGVSPEADSGLRHPGNHGFEEWFSAGNYFDSDPLPGTLFHNGKPLGQLRGESSDLVMSEALKFIRTQAQAAKPFLAVIWFPSPHWPYRARPTDKAPYANQSNADFLGEMAAVDRAMGQLRDELKALGVRDNTLLWFNSDNGAAGGSSGGLSGVKGSLLEGGIRVPGLIEWPARVRQPMRTRFPASTVDIFPTLCDAMGVPPHQDKPLDGISLLPLLDGSLLERPQPIGFQSSNTLTGQPIDAAWIQGRWKLLRCAHPLPRGIDTPGESVTPGEHLFDLETDPTESRDCRDSQPEIFEAMKAALDQWQASVAASAAEYLFTPPKRPPITTLGGKARFPILDDTLRTHRLHERWIGADRPSFDRHWDFSDSALRGRELPDDPRPAHCGTLLRHTDALLRISIKLEGAREARVNLESFSQEHIAGLVVQPTGVALHVRRPLAAGNATPSPEIISYPATIKPGEWHTFLWEMRGAETSLCLDGRPIGRATHATLRGVKEHLAFQVVGGTASFRDVCLWDTRDPDR